MRIFIVLFCFFFFSIAHQAAFAIFTGSNPLAFLSAEEQAAADKKGEEDRAWISERAYYNQRLGLLIGEPQCVQMDDDEHAYANQMLQNSMTLEKADEMYTSAVYYFGDSPIRMLPSTPILCIPEDIKSAAIAHFIKRGNFSSQLVGGDMLRAAFMLDSGSPEIIKAVGNTAFNSQPTGVTSLTEDTRPLARLVLAKFGSKSAQWSEQAFNEISAQDKLGTSAAALAIATDHPKAIENTAKLIDDILAQNAGRAINIFEDADRLYELAIALALAGEKSQPFIDTLVALSKQQIQGLNFNFSGGSAPDIYPDYICGIMKKIKGAKADAVLKTPLCVAH